MWGGSPVIADERVPSANSRTVELSVDGETLPVRYLQAGTEGPAVVLLHGSGVDDAALSWKRVIPALAETNRVYAPDWPGYGKSPSGEGRMTTNYYTDVLAAFLDAVDADQPSLVGISMGGAAALGYALDHQEVVTRLVLVDSYGLADTIPGGISAYLLANTPFAASANALIPTTRAYARSVVSPVLYAPETLPSAFYDEVAERLRGGSAVRSFVSFQRNEFTPDGVATDFSDRLSELSIPTLLIHGSADPLVSAEHSIAAAKRLPESRLCVLERCGHWPPRERPEAFETALLDFLPTEDGHSASTSNSPVVR